MLMGGRGCNQCSSSSSSRKPVGGKGNESRWRRACKLVAGYCSLWGAKAGAAALATALWMRIEAAPLLHLDCNCKGGWEQRRKEETPIPAQGSQGTRKKKRGREKETSIGNEGRAASREGPDDSVSVRQVAQEEAIESGDWRAPLKKRTVCYWLRAHYKRPPKSKLGIPF